MNTTSKTIFGKYGVIILICLAAIVLTCSLPVIGMSIQNARYKAELATLSAEFSKVEKQNEELSESIKALESVISDLKSEDTTTTSDSNTDVELPATESTEEPTIETVPSTDNTTPTTVQVTADVGLRIRSDKSIESTKIGLLAYGTVINVINSDDDAWYKLADNDGFISKEFTTTEIQEIALGAKLAGTTPAYDIGAPTGLSAEEFNRIIETFATNRNAENSILLGSGDALVQIEETYGFSGLFLLSVAGLESGFGVTNAALNRNNPLGIMQKGVILSFDSVTEAYHFYGNFTKKYYFDQGRDTITSIGKKYCPYTASEWASDVTWFYRKLIDLV